MISSLIPNKVFFKIYFWTRTKNSHFRTKSAMKKISTVKDPKIGSKKKKVGLGKIFYRKNLWIQPTQFNKYILEPTVRAVKTRIECRGQKEPRNPRQWLEISPEGKVQARDSRTAWFMQFDLDSPSLVRVSLLQATENQKSESTLFYLVPIGLRKRHRLYHIGYCKQNMLVIRCEKSF